MKSDSGHTGLADLGENLLPHKEWQSFRNSMCMKGAMAETGSRLSPGRPAPRASRMWSRSRSARALSRLAAAALAVLLAGCSYNDITFLIPHGPIAAQQLTYFIYIILALLIVVVPVFLLTPYFAWRYRYRNRSSKYQPDWEFVWSIEILAWGIPFCVVVVMSIWLWRGTHQLDPYKPLAGSVKALPVEVVGYDWKWLFIYPTLGVASVGQFSLPVDRPVAIKLTSDSVMQSFFIPSLGSQIYAMAGMTTQLHLKADHTGSYLGENTQYNGEGFQEQQFRAVAMSPANFEAWVGKVRTTGITLTPNVYGELSGRNKVSELRHNLRVENLPEGIVYFRDVPADLFKNIVAFFHGGPTVRNILKGTPAAAKSD